MLVLVSGKPLIFFWVRGQRRDHTEKKRIHYICTCKKYHMQRENAIEYQNFNDKISIPRMKIKYIELVLMINILKIISIYMCYIYKRNNDFLLIIQLWNESLLFNKHSATLIYSQTQIYSYIYDRCCIILIFKYSFFSLAPFISINTHA